MQSEFSKKHLIDFDKYMPQILEAFVAVYGEKYRENIAYRLSNIHFLFTGADRKLLTQTIFINLKQLTNPFTFIKEQLNVSREIFELKKENNIRYRPFKQKIKEYKKRVSGDKRYRLARFMAKNISHFLRLDYIYLDASEYGQLESLLCMEKDPESALNNWIEEISNKKGIKPNFYNNLNKNKKAKLLNRLRKTEPSVVPIKPQVPLSIIEDDSFRYIYNFKSIIHNDSYDRIEQALTDDNYCGRLEFCDTIDHKLLTFIFLNFNYKLLNDNVLIHEIVHAVDSCLNIEQVNGEDVVRINTGFKSEYRKYGTEENLRHIEDDQLDMYLHCFNEVCTQYKADKICDKLRKNKVKIASTGSSESTYHSSVVVLRPLLKYLEPQIIDIPFNGDYNDLLKVIKPEEFTVLGRCVEQLFRCYENYELDYVEERTGARFGNFDAFYRNIDILRKDVPESMLVETVTQLESVRDSILARLQEDTNDLK